MPDLKPAAKAPIKVLLVEPEAMLRRTVALTARSLGMAEVYEAASTAAGQRMLYERAFQGAVIAVDCAPAGKPTDLSLLDEVRKGGTASDRAMPIAVLAEQCSAEFLQALRQREIKRVILKPFRAKLLLEAFAELAAAKK
jgi:CheY-like chemotaxis protein